MVTLCFDSQYSLHTGLTRRAWWWQPTILVFIEKHVKKLVVTHEPVLSSRSPQPSFLQRSRRGVWPSCDAEAQKKQSEGCWFWELKVVDQQGCVQTFWLGWHRVGTPGEESAHKHISTVKKLCYVPLYNFWCCDTYSHLQLACNNTFPLEINCWSKLSIKVASYLDTLHMIPEFNSSRGNDWHEKHSMLMLTVCCCSVFPHQQDKAEEASGELACPASPAPLNQPPPPSRPTHRWHVIARHWLRQTRRRTSGVLPVTTRSTRTSRDIYGNTSWTNTTTSRVSN